MEDNRITLARVLIEKTRDGSLSWQQSDANDVQVVVGKNTVVVAQSYDGEADQFRMAIRVYGRDGTLVEDFTDEDLKSWVNELWFSRLHDMYKAAKRNSLGADKLLDEIVAELTKNDLPGQKYGSPSDDDIPF